MLTGLRHLSRRLRSSEFYRSVSTMGSVPQPIDNADGANLERPIYKDGKFSCAWAGAGLNPYKDVLRYLLLEGNGKQRLETREKEHKKTSPSDIAAAFPVHDLDYKALQSPPVDAIQASWIGHATMLVQMGGLTFMTDPVLGSFMGPSRFIAYKRLVDVPFQLTDNKLPDLDFVVISHNHYDHLDYPTVMQLHKRFGSKMTWYVPLKLGSWFEKCGIRGNVVELDWWQSVQHGTSGVRVALTPAQHWSNRGSGRNASLWGGFCVLTDKLRFYFAGDTGYCHVFPQIAQQYGPFDLSAIPIGAYMPEYMMKMQHANPAEAVKIHQDVQSKRSVGIHCCTFHLTQEALDAPPRWLAEEASKAGLKENEFVTLQHGSMIVTADGTDRSTHKCL